jgi:hypothetical protein
MVAASSASLKAGLLPGEAGMELGRGNGEVGRLAQSGPDDAVGESFAVGSRLRENHHVESDALAFLDTGADAHELRKLIDHHHHELSVSRQFVL